jgi:DNA-binding response OmpR family regulator
MLHAFILDDDPTTRGALAELVEMEGFAVTVAGSIAEARQRLTDNVPDVALVDQVLPDTPSCIARLPREIRFSIPVSQTDRQSGTVAASIRTVRRYAERGRGIVA